MHPVALFKRERYTVALFGGHGSLQEWLLYAKSQLRTSVRCIALPPKPGWFGFQTISHQYDSLIQTTEGFVVPKGTAMAVRTKDCATLVAYNAATDTLAFGHIGRHGLTPPADCTACGFTTVSTVLRAVSPPCTDHSQVEVFITGSICGQCYRFDQPGAASLLDPFRSRYPAAVIDDTGFDQVIAIRSICEYWGIPRAQIHHDGLCTLEHEHLTSYRAGDQNSNTVVVIHH